MSARLRFSKSNNREAPSLAARAWALTSLGVLAASASCGPIAKSAFKTNRFAAPAERQEARPPVDEPLNSTPSTNTGLAPVLEVRKPLPVRYITRVVDAANLESLRALLEGAFERSGPSPTPSPSPSQSSSGVPSEADSRRIIVASGMTESIELTEEQLEALQGTGRVELVLPELPVGMSPSKITGVFHVIQNDEFELLEEDDEFSTELDLFKNDQGYQGTLRTIQDPAQDQKTASTLSRLVRVDIEVEAALQGPIAGGPKAETVSVPGTVSAR